MPSLLRPRAVLLGLSFLVLGVTGAASPREVGSALAADAAGESKSSRLVRRESSRRFAVDAKGHVAHEAAVADTVAASVTPPLAENGGQLPPAEPASPVVQDAKAPQSLSDSSAGDELSRAGSDLEGGEDIAPALTAPEADLSEAQASEGLSGMKQNPSEEEPGDESEAEASPGSDDAGTNASQPNLGPFYLKKASHRCGACGTENDLHIGYANHTSDTAGGGEVLEVCGDACNRHESCGGFDYLRTVGRCYYRKSTACEESSDADRDCYVKVPATLVEHRASDW